VFLFYVLPRCPLRAVRAKWHHLKKQGKNLIELKKMDGNGRTIDIKGIYLIYHQKGRLTKNQLISIE
jgi:hypothetical protein